MLEKTDLISYCLICQQVSHIICQCILNKMKNTKLVRSIMNFIK